VSRNYLIGEEHAVVASPGGLVRSVQHEAVGTKITIMSETEEINVCGDGEIVAAVDQDDKEGQNGADVLSDDTTEVEGDEKGPDGPSIADAAEDQFMDTVESAQVGSVAALTDLEQEIFAYLDTLGLQQMPTPAEYQSLTAEQREDLKGLRGRLEEESIAEVLGLEREEEEEGEKEDGEEEEDEDDREEDTEDAACGVPKRAAIYDLSKNKVHDVKLAPNVDPDSLPPGITEKDLKDAFAMFDFDGSGSIGAGELMQLLQAIGVQVAC